MSKKKDAIAEKLALVLIAHGGSYSAPYVQIWVGNDQWMTLDIHAVVDAFRSLIVEALKP